MTYLRSTNELQLETETTVSPVTAVAHDGQQGAPESNEMIQ